MMSQRNRRLGLSILFSIILMVVLARAGLAGKISGVITDAKTGEALPGANIYLAGTSLGAASGPNGVYEILNVPQGSYTVTV
ncbi:MAG: carboxypeptidase-like regulatory domain-containing protein, partial [candidate division KSB1 bacterium]|nr:carboxypeptidase-like regulatory domain-containing protein [candidate division KSB1 bacterium]